jgi:hypothetical protein
MRRSPRLGHLSSVSSYPPFEFAGEAHGVRIVRAPGRADHGKDPAQVALDDPFADAGRRVFERDLAALAQQAQRVARMLRPPALAELGCD